MALIGIIPVFGLNALSWVFLLGVAAGRPWLVLDQKTVMERFVPAVSLLYFILAYAASIELCSAGADGRSFKLKQTEDHLVASLSTTPGALFIMLFIQGIVQIASLGRGTDQRLVAAPMLAVHFMGGLFYTLQGSRTHCALAARWAAGSGHTPMHYALWISSVSSQMITLSHLEQGLERQSGDKRDGAQSSSVPRAAHRRCAVALLGVQGMLIFGGLGDAWHGPLLANCTCIFLSFLSFYVMLLTGIAQPLAACQRHVLSTDTKAVADRYRKVSLYLILVYHVFPLVWALDNTGWLGDYEARMGYTVADVLAKLLPPSIYITMLAMPPP